jgi:hypothetical protein
MGYRRFVYSVSEAVGEVMVAAWEKRGRSSKSRSRTDAFRAVEAMGADKPICEIRSMALRGMCFSVPDFGRSGVLR